MIIPSKCPHCGAQILFNSNNPIAECDYCNSIVMLEKKKEEHKEKPKEEKKVVVNNVVVNVSGLGVADAINKAENYAKELVESFSVRELKPTQKLLVRYELGDTHQRGKIFITDYEIVFKPFESNKGDKNIRYIPFSEISSISSNSSEYLFAKKISFNLHGGKRIHIHIKSKYSKLFIQEIKEKKAFNAKNKILRSSLMYNEDINGAVNAKEVSNYRTPQYVRMLKKYWKVVSPILLAFAYGVSNALKNEKRRGGGELTNLMHSIPKEISFIIFVFIICSLVYFPWKFYRDMSL